MKAASWI